VIRKGEGKEDEKEKE